ncbi:MAG: hypothetical protein EBR82_26400 [Caulobacteraceae bacterium]|nr:hypothetical protein [Caulobacteraceae bacterium]
MRRYRADGFMEEAEGGHWADYSDALAAIDAANKRAETAERERDEERSFRQLAESQNRMHQLALSDKIDKRDALIQQAIEAEANHRHATESLAAVIAERDYANECLAVQAKEITRLQAELAAALSVESSKVPDVVRRLALAVAEVRAWRYGNFVTHQCQLPNAGSCSGCEASNRRAAATAATDSDPVLRAMVEKGGGEG